MSGRRTTLGAVAVLALSVVVPMSGATAAAETCRGEKATIVGTAGRDVVGTEGRDVVVTNGATQVDTFGGNDVVCISGKHWAWIAVDTGAGDDYVFGLDSSQPVFADLGTGQDGMAGGHGDDRIATDLSDSDPRGDAVGGGRGRDTLTLYAGAGDIVVDYANGVARVDDRVAATFATFEDLWLQRSDARSFTFVGSSSAESVVVDEGASPIRLDVDLGDGDDSLATNGVPAASSAISGGSGRDLVDVASPESGLALDLLTGVLKVGGPPTYSVPVAQFEDANLFSPSVGLNGTPGPNRLGTTSCFGNVSGRGGDDVLRRQYDGTFETELVCKQTVYRFEGASGNDRIFGSGADDGLNGGTGRDTIRGGGGRDHLVGGAGADRLLGGPGRDRADGGKGTDRCLTERQRNCER